MFIIYSSIQVLVGQFIRHFLIGQKTTSHLLYNLLLVDVPTFLTLLVRMVILLTVELVDRDAGTLFHLKGLVRVLVDDLSLDLGIPSVQVVKHEPVAGRECEQCNDAR